MDVEVDSHRGGGGDRFKSIDDEHRRGSSNATPLGMTMTVGMLNPYIKGEETKSSRIVHEVNAELEDNSYL